MALTQKALKLLRGTRPPLDDPKRVQLERFAPFINREASTEAEMSSGPRWEALEDSGWFRESTATDAMPVWEEVEVQRKDLKTLSREEAVPYLPSSSVLADNGTGQPPPPVSCCHGPRLGQCIHNYAHGMGDSLDQVRIRGERIGGNGYHAIG
ncbi:hypothetical protein DACRYDRAFT_17422 [Dacryopinax primogenitus]|uniref:Uncharacterized protein n=1 Tax=Dacryopinax primogenitus (strain DJM 731) TaxID=1858805 RepID=M5FQN4_DACPD|nr:uncharacterized protein DACRYDRAFT_17422 [Dacryopinax primogenitus]EJT99220.1 hypothetical protein DACRYDRAFT_17422 [Dacryopinax primogenitus]